MIVFVARNKKTGKAFQVPEMGVSEHDDLNESRKCFELGLTIKNWSQEKGKRDMHRITPSFQESSHYNDYLRKLDQIKRVTPEKVIRMSDTE